MDTTVARAVKVNVPWRRSLLPSRLHLARWEAEWPMALTRHLTNCVRIYCPVIDTLHAPPQHGRGPWTDLAEEASMTTRELGWLSALDSHCLGNMDPAHQRAIILECSGRSHEEIAEMEHVSGGTVRQWIRIASSEIGLCLPAGARVGKVVRGYWVGRHVSDCLTVGLGLLRGETAGGEPGPHPGRDGR